MSLAARIDDAAAWSVRLLAVAVVLFLVVPIAICVVLSFDARDYLGSFPPTVWSLRWYRAFFDNPSYLDGLLVSLRLALLASCIAVVAGTATAVFLARSRFPGRAMLETVFLMPKFVPTVVIGFSLLGFTAAIGIRDAFTRLLIGHAVIVLPFTIRAALASLVGIRPSLVEAAVSLGASERRALLDIVVPLARTGIAAGAVMAFVLSFDEVAVSLFLSDPFTQTLPVVLIAEMRANLNLTIAAVSTAFLVLTGAVLVLLDRTLGLDRVIGQGIYRT
jgi:putative spermidine/putrescine transport system permease protein